MSGPEAPATPCANCGTELPAGAGFCWRCGLSQAPRGERQPAPAETCEICYTTDQGVLITCHLWARAVGPHGEYNAGESRAWVSRYPYPDNPEAIAARAALVRQLVEDGWQHTGTGLCWFNDHFSRPS